MKRAWMMVTAALLAAAAAQATETSWWTVDTPEELLKGRGDGVAVTDDGRLVNVPRWPTAVTLEEPVVMAGAVLPDGSLVVGTGYPARLYQVDGGKATLLTEVPAVQVTAMLARADGSLLVATMSPAALFRVKGTVVQELGRLGEGGIWDLAELAGSVVMAAGPPASLYRLGDKGLERWGELPDGFARCLAVQQQALLVGTSGKGLIFSVSSSGQISLVADSPFTEIADLLAAPDGSVWAVALVGEPPKAPEQPKQKEDETSTSAAPADLELPKVDGATASSELLRLTPEGALLRVHRFTPQVASALAWDGEGVLVGTGFEGEIWRFVSGGGARLATVDAVQTVAFVDDGAVALTQGPGSVRRREKRDSQGGRYRVDAQRFPQPVRYGEYRLLPSGAGASIRFRSGASEKPDDSWLPWTDWLPGTGGTVPLPAGRSLQWEVELPAGDAAVLERVEVAYVEVNLAPELDDVEVEEPGVIYLSGPPPSGPVVDVSHPDFAGIFSVIDEQGSGEARPKQGKKFYRVGFRTLSWSAKDPNDDPLLFQVELERDDGFVLPVDKDLDTTQLAVDTTAVPDGSYRLRVTASDEQRNPGDPRRTTALSAWFEVDSTPPLLAISRNAGEWVVTATDAGSSVARVEWSRDGDRWHTLAPVDGVLDGRQEKLVFPAASGRHLVVVRAIDRHHNRAVAGAVEQ